MEETFPRNGLSSNENRNEKSVVSLGDSIIKKINGYELSNLVEKGKSIVQLASALKTELRDVSISCITARRDRYSKKAIEVNKKLKNLCLENSLYLIDHGSTINNRHVNGSKLHLNKNGTRVLFSYFKEAISNILL